MLRVSGGLWTVWVLDAPSPSWAGQELPVKMGDPALFVSLPETRISWALCSWLLTTVSPAVFCFDAVTIKAGERTHLFGFLCCEALCTFRGVFSLKGHEAKRQTCIIHLDTQPLGRKVKTELWVGTSWSR